MEKQSVRRWVLETLKSMINGEYDECEDDFIKFKIYRFADDFGGLWSSDFEIQVLDKDGWRGVRSFTFNEYFFSDWDLITRPWINDMANDITDVVVELYDKKYKNNLK